MVLFLPSIINISSMETIPSTPVREILEIEKHKAMLNRELFTLYCTAGDIWNKSVIIIKNLLFA